MDQQFRAAISAASHNPAALSAVADIYLRLQSEIDARRPLCIASGRCCHFESFGHRLFITTLELAAFLHDFNNSPARHQHRAALRDFSGQGCPFQLNKLCSVHAFRPFGCRIFFCDPTSTDWQQQRYERFHAELKSLHDTLKIPYFYLEWRHALRALFPSDSSDQPANVPSQPLWV
ncbi:MAG TPA: hypothetical protein VIL86_02910 [Tepidisphaeraceae bacterium]|jgi:Fe-S-cluster containining protein